MTSLQPLPIDPFLPQLVETLRKHPALVLEAPPGAGKTTRLPRALLDAGFADPGEIWVLEPRRLAARLAARRVAYELREPLGERIGYAVRFDSVGGPKTRVRFVTEGILLRRLTSAPDLAGVSAVLLDEFHERHLETDVALACLLRLQQTTRPDLKLAVLSATLDAEPVARHLECPAIQCEGRAFPVDIRHQPTPDNGPVVPRVAEALRSLVTEGLDGDALVFLPGVGEIAAVEKACQELAARNNLQLLRLHGSLAKEEQDQALRPSERRKVILSTNVAETSVTIEGITVVIDSGQVKEAGHSPWSGLPTLQTQWTSQASAIQRAGRAGRTRPGRCLRLYTLREFQSMRPFTEPELQRAELSGLLLMLKGSGVSNAMELPWLQPPPSSALQAAETLLKRLGALGSDSEITPVGRRMLDFPAHPRLARILCEAEQRNMLEAGALLAAILESPDPRPSRRWSGQRRTEKASNITHPSDPIHIAEALKHQEVAEYAREPILAAARKYGEKSKRSPALDPSRIEEHQQLLLAGFPDRVARRVRPNSNEILLCNGTGAFLAEESVVTNAEFLIALEARDDPRRGGRIYVSRASAIEPEWLFELPDAPVSDKREVRWDGEKEKVEVVESLLYENLPLESKALPPGRCPEAAEILAKEALRAGLGRFFGQDAFETFMGRVLFVKSIRPEFEVPDESRAEQLLRDACRKRSSFRELEQANLLPLLRYGCAPEAQKALERLAPEEIQLPSGQRLRVNYPRSGRPWAEELVQTFYGMAEGPKVGGGRTPVLLHLLAPNHRPAQVTDDLAGFWAGSYALVRKDLRGRYPKHYWPDDPASADPVLLRRQAKAEP